MTLHVIVVLYCVLSDVSWRNTVTYLCSEELLLQANTDHFLCTEFNSSVKTKNLIINLKMPNNVSSLIVLIRRKKVIGKKNWKN